MAKKLFFPAVLVAAIVGSNNSLQALNIVTNTCYCATPAKFEQSWIVELAPFDGRVYTGVVSCKDCVVQCYDADRAAFSYNECYGALGSKAHNENLCKPCGSK
jgi:hypothetical protein